MQLFHLTANLGNEIFQTHPDSKVIQTGILLLLTAWVLWKIFQTASAWAGQLQVILIYGFNVLNST